MSVTALDPIENKELTYTFMVPYLKAFFHFGLSVDSIGIHPYMNQWGLMGITDMTAREFKRPVWVTEFNVSDETLSMEDTRTYLIQAVDFLERSPNVEGYAFFKERVLDPPKISLLANELGKLTPLGEAYLQVPTHDADIYYRVPGRLQAEKYTALDGAQIWPTHDADGFAHMAFNEPGATLSFNIHVGKPGKYLLRARVTGQPGRMRVLGGEQVLGTINAAPEAGKWATVETSVELAAGAQTIRFEGSASGMGLNWIEVAAG